MYQFPVGVLLESFRLPTREAIRAAAALGLQGLQMYATQGENAPENLLGWQRKDLLRFVRDHGLCFSAICGDLGQGFMNPGKNPELIDRSKRIMELAADLDCSIVTTHIGVVPADKNHPRYGILHKACYELAQFADAMGAHFAIETGPEPAAVLKAFLDDLGSTGVAVNLDPANLVMVTGDDPVAAVHTLQNYIVHTHAKDGVSLLPSDPERVYHAIEHDGWDEETTFREVPLGQGGVDFPGWLRALEGIGYTGFLTIEREVGDDPAADIALAAEYLHGIMK